jgi:hypothetical protein
MNLQNADCLNGSVLESILKSCFSSIEKPLVEITLSSVDPKMLEYIWENTRGMLWNSVLLRLQNPIRDDFATKI